MSKTTIIPDFIPLFESYLFYLFFLASFFFLKKKNYFVLFLRDYFCFFVESIVQETSFFRYHKNKQIYNTENLIKKKVAFFIILVY